jgi:hypothetical protein
MTGFHTYGPRYGSSRWLGVGVSRSRRLFVFLLALVAATAISAYPAARPARAGVFGFDYWPYCMSNDALGNSDGVSGPDWDEHPYGPTDIASNVRPIVERDLDHIASLGGGVIRLVIVPSGVFAKCDSQDMPKQTGTWSAWQLPNPTTGAPAKFTSEFTDETSNIADLIGLAQASHFKVIVTFANTYLHLDSSDCPGKKIWECKYGAGGWGSFLADAEHWVDGYVGAIEASPYRDAVIAYDYFNEASNPVPHAWEYVNHLYDHSLVPAGKRLVSVLRADPAKWCPTTCPPPGTTTNDVDLLHTNLAGRTLNFVDFHSYPNNTDPTNPDPVRSYNHIVSVFGNDIVRPTVFMGEFGAKTSWQSGDEAGQATLVTNLMSVAQGNDLTPTFPNTGHVVFPYYLHWTLWDEAPPNTSQVLGLGYDPNNPKDALGAVSTEMNSASAGGGQIIPNPDMETGDSSGMKPADWSSGPQTGPVVPELRRMGPPQTTGATGNYFARLQLANPTPPARVWLTSARVNVPAAGQVGRQLFVNAYVRSNMTDVHVGVTEYDSTGQIKQTAGPDFDPFTPDGTDLPAWAWRNYLAHVGAWEIPLDQATTKVIVAVSGTTASSSVSGNSYLDVDTTSAAVRCQVGC